MDQGNLRPRSVLIVEDEQIVALDLQQTLHDLGYEVFAIASSAEEAIARASERRPDLVLMDIRIKGQRDGIEAAEVLHTQFSIPVVFLTAHTNPATIERAKRVEPAGYLVKPVKVAELRSVIEVALHKHEIDTRLRERERWFSTTLRSIGDAILAVDLAGRITFMNPAAEVLTGMDARSAMGQPVQSVLQLSDRPAGESPVLTALRQEQLVELHEASLRNVATGACRVISDSATPVRLDEQLLGAVMVFRDVTEQKQLQKRLELADRLVSLGTMAAGVAHEVNNPLAVVLANAGFVAEDLSALGVSSLDEAKRRQSMVAAVRDIQSAAGRIERIVADLRAFCQSAVQPERSGQTDIRRCIEWAVRATAHEFRDRATVKTDIASVPPVHADEMRLGQVLINLLVNAAHATAPGNEQGNEVTITARTESTGRAVIEVRDTGTGIPSAVIERIFEPFFTTKSHGQGTGLGLSICHGIVVAMGGEIKVDSELGKGTVFRVFLPAAKPRAAEPATPAARELQVRGRILVVDDEEMMLRALTRVLHEHEVRFTASAEQALSWLDAGQTFDLILSDLIMPTMTGMEFYEKLLARHPELAPRVIFMTGGTITPRANAFLLSIPNARLEKPFNAVELQKMVRERLAGEAALVATDASC